MRVNSNPGTMAPMRHSLSLEPSRQRFLTADGEALSFPTDGSVFSLGQGPECAIHWEGPNVQARHAEGKWEEGSLWVRDCDSGATLVNGARVKGGEWTRMGDGACLQLGDINDSALSLAVMSGDAPQETFTSHQSEKPMLVTFFGDASAPDIGKHVKGQPGRFERALGKTQAPVQVRGLVAEGGVAADAAYSALPVVMGALGAAGVASAATAGVQALLGGPLSLPMLAFGGLLAVSGGFGAWLGWDGSKDHFGALKQKLGSKDEVAPNWTHVSNQVIAKGPRASQFEQLWHENLAQWPNSRHVVYLSGHGLQQRAAGLSFDHLAATVQGAEAIVLDACNGGQLESLCKLTGSARVAVASEHTVRGFGFPLESMFGQSSFPSDPRQLGETLVRSAARGRPAQSLVAVDLQALQKQLLPSLDRLGRSLTRLSQQGHEEAIRGSLDSSETTDASQTKAVVDLGSFLAQLAERPSLAGCCPELQRTTQAFNQTVLAMLGHGTLSFDRYPATHLPDGWRQFLQQMRK